MFLPSSSVFWWLQLSKDLAVSIGVILYSDMWCLVPLFPHTFGSEKFHLRKFVEVGSTFSLCGMFWGHIEHSVLCSQCAHTCRTKADSVRPKAIQTISEHAEWREFRSFLFWFNMSVDCPCSSYVLSTLHFWYWFRSGLSLSCSSFNSWLLLLCFHL